MIRLEHGDIFVNIREPQHITPHDLFGDLKIKSTISPKNFSKYLVSKEGKIYNKNNKEIKGYYNGSGLCVKLIDDDRKHQVFVVSRLVLQLFTDKEEHKSRVLHKNKNIKDNRLENLKWVTSRDITIKTRNKSKCSHQKMSLIKANNVRELYKTGKYAHSSLAKKYKVSQSTITQILNNRLWCSPEENTRDPMMTYELAEQIRKEYIDVRGEQTRLAEKYGVKQGLICKIVNNKMYVKK